MVVLALRLYYRINIKNNLLYSYHAKKVAFAAFFVGYITLSLMAGQDLLQTVYTFNRYRNLKRGYYGIHGLEL